MNPNSHILLVDDNSLDLEMALIAFGEVHPDLRIDTARDGAEALDYLMHRGKFTDREKRNPALVLLDIKMPKVDGHEVLRQMKANERLKLIPVVMLTSSREESDLLRSYSLGVNGYVVKPVDFKQFNEAIDVLGKYWLTLNEQPL